MIRLTRPSSNANGWNAAWRILPGRTMAASIWLRLSRGTRNWLRLTASGSVRKASQSPMKSDRIVSAIRTRLSGSAPVRSNMATNAAASLREATLSCPGPARRNANSSSNWSTTIRKCDWGSTPDTATAASSPRSERRSVWSKSCASCGEHHSANWYANRRYGSWPGRTTAIRQAVVPNKKPGADRRQESGADQRRFAGAAGAHDGHKRRVFHLLQQIVHLRLAAEKKRMIGFLERPQAGIGHRQAVGRGAMTGPSAPDAPGRKRCRAREGRCPRRNVPAGACSATAIPMTVREAPSKPLPPADTARGPLLAS